jgi:hypothetical protein
VPINFGTRALSGCASSYGWRTSRAPGGLLDLLEPLRE